jgi:hypothetical protein
LEPSVEDPVEALPMPPPRLLRLQDMRPSNQSTKQKETQTTISNDASSSQQPWIKITNSTKQTKKKNFVFCVCQKVVNVKANDTLTH